MQKLINFFTPENPKFFFGLLLFGFGLGTIHVGLVFVLFGLMLMLSSVPEEEEINHSDEND